MQGTSKFSCYVLFRLQRVFLEYMADWLFLSVSPFGTDSHLICTSFLLFIFLKFYFIFKLYIIVLVSPNIKMNPPQVYMCSPSWTLLPPPSPYHPSGSSQCSSPKHPVSCIEPGLAFFDFSVPFLILALEWVFLALNFS